MALRRAVRLEERIIHSMREEETDVSNLRSFSRSSISTLELLDLSETY